MTQLQNPPEKTTRRAGLPRFSDNPDTRSVQIGVLGTVLLHVLLFVAVPYFLKFQPVKKFTPPDSQQFDVELAPEEFEAPQPLPPPKPPAPFKFVEVNPDAPDNVPDKTDNFGAQNQQVAQEKPSPETGSDRPAMEGKKDFESTQIVSGQLSQQTLPSAPPTPMEVPQQGRDAQQRAEQNPLHGFEKAEGEELESYGTNVAKLPEATPNAQERVEGQKNIPVVDSATGMMPRIDPKRPRPAPKLEKRARPAIFAENKIGTQNIGPVAVDAKWSNYGQYLQQLIETVQIQWDRILIQSRVYPPSGTMVVVKFILNKKGEIERIIEVGPELSPEQAKQSCVSAITARSPYGDWTDDMVKVLGESQEMTFSFYYQ